MPHVRLQKAANLWYDNDMASIIIGGKKYKITARTAEMIKAVLKSERKISDSQSGSITLNYNGNSVKYQPSPLYTL